MAPKKVMKTMKKKNDLEKSPQKKGLEKPSNQRGLEKSSGRKGLEKPMKKPGCNDGDGLEKPGTIKDKVKAAAEEAEGDADQGAAILHGSLSKLDKSKLWAKHQASLRGNKALEKAHAQLGKKEKGIAACKWLLEKEGKQFLQASRRVSVGEVVTKTDNWETELQMLTRYSPEELEMHLQSGKVTWRECPYTSGTFEYKDTQNWHKAINTARQKEWQSGVEFEPEDEDLEKFMELFSTDCHSLSVDEGLGKSSAKGLGKGQGSLGKGRRGRGRAIKEEEDKDEPDPHEKLAKACRTARNMVSATMSDLEEALEKAGSKLTKAGKTTANDLSKELGKALQKIKTLLTGKSKLQDDPVKGQLMEVAQVVKTAKDETKKLLALGGCLLLLQSQVILEKVPQGAAGALEKATSWTKGLGKCHTERANYMGHTLTLYGKVACTPVSMQRTICCFPAVCGPWQPDL